MQIRPRLGILPNVPGKALEKVAGDHERCFHVLLEHGFIRVVAYAAGAAEEEHGGGQTAGHHDGVVTRTAGHGFYGEAGGLNGIGKERSEALVHGHGGLFQLASAGEV